MNTEMRRTLHLLRDVLPARALLALAAITFTTSVLAWPAPVLLRDTATHPLEFAPSLLLGALGVLTAWIGGRREMESLRAARAVKARQSQQASSETKEPS